MTIPLIAVFIPTYELSPFKDNKSLFIEIWLNSLSKLKLSNFSLTKSVLFLLLTTVKNTLYSLLSSRLSKSVSPENTKLPVSYCSFINPTILYSL